ncbi:unnamed protein product [Peronospora belbahrii]|uniref:Uncharacterized protein n=1 Tax=Peronospora belbahrii TaxID=622444 RepID=A0ABN8CWE7_9STRA|nr:unnamed protein product [Peronospora belbahrii]
MKRVATQPITAFFRQKQIKRRSIESIESSTDDNNDEDHHHHHHVRNDNIKDKKKRVENNVVRVKRISCKRDDHFMTSMLHYRELVGCATTTQQLIGGIPSLRRRRKQQLVRWILSQFQRLPLKLESISSNSIQSGNESTRRQLFYTSWLEFDLRGILLVAGASNGMILLYDFDEVFHHILNLGQRMDEEKIKDKTAEDTEQGEDQRREERLYPIHTIFTSFEVKCIRWNPLNEDEIACSFTNRNEIHIYNLSTFPSKPQKILKSSNHPSSGYNDLLYVSVTQTTSKVHSKVVHVIAGDMDGAVRMWDCRFPSRPMWSFLTGSLKTSINALLLSSDKQFLICGNEAGMLMTYDIQHKFIPAFGSKPVPQRKAVFNIMETIKPYLSPALIEGVLITSRHGSPGIMSLHLVPESETYVLCQLRNDWVVVIDYLLGSVVKLHTFLRGSMPRDKSKSDASPSVLSMVSESEYQRDFVSRSLRHSWLSCHRCTGTFLFDKSILCTGIHDAKSLTMIDLHQLRVATDQKSDASKFGAASSDISELPAVERIHRFRIPMNGVVTAVASHPNQHLVICGGENMRLQIMGAMG